MPLGNSQLQHDFHEPTESTGLVSASAGAATVSLEEVITTMELDYRPTRRPDYQAEVAALSDLAQALSRSPESIFQDLVDCALRLCGAQSAGLSLLEEVEGRSVFRWRATAGAFASLAGNTLPREFSPCGAVLDRDALQLMSRPVRHYPYIAQLPVEVHEVLLVPFRHNGRAIGTVWVVAHEPETRFDHEDARIATSLSQFAAAAWQALNHRAEIERNRRQLRTKEQEQASSHAQLALANERAKSTDAQFHAFFEQAPFYTAILSTDGRVSEIGRLAVEACGYTADMVLGKFFWDTAWWRGSAEVRHQVRAAFDTALGGQRFQANLPYVMADGLERWTDFGMSPVYDEKGAVTFLIATGTDITDRVQTELKLTTVQKRLDSALIAAEIGTYEWDILNDRLHGDQNFLRMFGVPVDETGGAPVASFVAALHPDDRARVAQSINHSVTTGENYEEDYRVVLPHGERWINARGRMVKDASGRVVSFFGLAIDITSRKRIEREREEIADHLRRLTAIHETVLSSTNDFAYVFDLEGRFVYANRPLLEIYGRKLEAVVGKTFSELGYPAWHAELHLREIATVIATKQPVRGEVPFKGESGISGIFDYIFTPVFGADGKVEAVAGTTRDVTDRKRGEDRDRLLIALDDTTRPLTEPQAITQAAARLLGDHLRVNRCAYADVEDDENTFNLTGDYNVGVPSIVGRYRFDQFGEECLRLMRAGEPYLISDSETDPRTATVREAYRTTRIRSVICVPLKKSGRFVAAMAVHQVTPRTWLQSDVDTLLLVANQCWESIERTRVIRVLAESEQRLRLAVKTGRLGVWELDLQSGVLTSSDQCKANYGRPPESVFPYEELLQTVHPEDRERMQAVVARSIAEGTEFDIEYRTVWPDGSTHWSLVRGQKVSVKEGKPTHMIGVSLDITERKEAEREQMRLREEAVRASRAKDDFLAMLSHELRTPLNPVLLIASDAAQDPNLSAEARASFEMIRQNIDLEARLIDDLLDLTTIVRGKLVVKKESRSLHTILTEAIAAVRPEFEAKAVRLEVKFDAVMHTVHVDGVRLLQVFINLLKNAAKFTPTGGVAVLTTAAKNHAEIVIQLTDTGIGMTPQELARVFTAFEQGDHANETSAHRFGGLGLGLAISQRLVELHGGTIEALSDGRDRGTTFTVILPLHLDAGPPDRTFDHSPPGPRETSPHDGLRLLLVEDHAPTRRTLEQLLRRRNYTVIPAASLAEAREKSASGEIDFVISDLGLPDGNGLTLMSELRDRFKLQGIALTGYGMEDDVARCRAAGFVTHLTKPIRIEALEAALRDSLKNAKPSRP